MNAENAQKVKALKPIADDLGLTRAQLALAWALRQPGLSSLITGATKVQQVEGNVKAAEITLSSEALAEIDRLFG